MWNRGWQKLNLEPHELNLIPDSETFAVKITLDVSALTIRPEHSLGVAGVQRARYVIVSCGAVQSAPIADVGNAGSDLQSRAWL